MCVHSPRQTAIHLFSVFSFACYNSIKQCFYSTCIKFIDISYNFIAACTYSFKIYRPFITAYLTKSMQPALISLPPQKDTKLKDLQDRVHKERKERVALEAKIEQLTSRSRVEVDPTLHQDLVSIMKGNNGKITAEFPEGTFRRLFWEQQLRMDQNK